MKRMSEVYSLKNKTIFVAGHNGLVGSALCRRLEQEDCTLLTANKDTLDLRDQGAVQKWMSANKPDAVIMAAAKVGGIGANIDAPAEFLFDNLMIEANVIHSAYECGVEKLLFLGSSCIYPKDAPQPMKEEYVLSGALEPTNEAYAIAKIAGIKLCQTYRKQYGCDFISAMPCNLYGPQDTFDTENSHVIPALILKMHHAKNEGAGRVKLWGSGTPLREFLYVDDLADGLVFMMKNYSGDAPLNIGSGEEISIKELAVMIAEIVGFDGEIIFDSDKPDGVSRKLLCSKRLNEKKWHSKMGLFDGIRLTYDWFLGAC